MMRYPDCPACRGAEGDPELHRMEVWSDDLWRLTTSLSAEVVGFSYLEPRRHIVAITAIDGDEARTLGDNHLLSQALRHLAFAIAEVGPSESAWQLLQEA